MSDPARILDALTAAAPAGRMPRLTLAEASVALARLTEPRSAPPVTIAPPRLEVPSAPLATYSEWNNAGAPIPSAPPVSIAPPILEPPEVAPVAFDEWNNAGAPVPSAPPVSIAPPQSTPDASVADMDWDDAVLEPPPPPSVETELSLDALESIEDWIAQSDLAPDGLLSAPPPPPPPDAGDMLDAIEAWLTPDELAASGPPVSIAPPRIEPPSMPAPIDPADVATLPGLPEVTDASLLPDLPEIPVMPELPALATSGATDAPQLIIVSEPPEAQTPMFRLSDLEALDAGPRAGAETNEAIAPAAPPPLPADSISEMITAAAAEMERNSREDEVIDLDMTSVEVVFLDD